MSAVDKIKNAVENAVGEVKEKVGDLTDNHDLEAEGKKDQASSTVKDAGEKVKDVFKD